jgi:hypothetical protein
MRRTLLAVGVGVLSSFLYVPYGGKHHGVFFNRGHDPFWSVPYDLIAVTPLVLQTIFLGVLLAVVVNVRWPRKKNRMRTSTTNSPNAVAPSVRSRNSLKGAEESTYLRHGSSCDHHPCASSHRVDFRE